ncbi:hypothetical protein MLD38_010108 [Melastoma candidum]|uniref:Uncharacterized protein n=1 Tax=Melastoma candidum TaxID=119954 RepID=A0ACB9QYV2_9MYRT|nr:hypothetical protein MLD38_010108 [Melastoma candidum]
MPPHHHHHSTSLLCTRAHKILYLFLVSATFFLTRFIDRSASPCSPMPSPSSDLSLRFSAGGGHEDRLSLKLYVYEEDEIDGLRPLLYGRDGKIAADDCVKGQWGTQEINQTYVKVLSQMTYFRLSGGRNHIFVFPSGAGAHLFWARATYINRSIILTPEGDRTDKRDTSAFNTWKDIIIPGNVDNAMTSQQSAFVQPLPLRQRKYLANFLGRAQSKDGRLRLIELAKQFPDKLESPELKLKGPEKLGRKEYFEHLRNAKFCLAPRGESSWTVRFNEAFFVECVPVILSDQVELPFQNVIDYRKVSIKWPSTQIGPELLDYLESIPDELIEQMISHGRQIRCLWVYNSELEPCSATHGILWELQRKVRYFYQSTETFWLHNGSIVNRELIDFSHWRPPMPLL